MEGHISVHLDVSRTILNYGQWFTFVYDINT